ncbi:hypothetical protein [Spongiibacter marinus]
MANYYHSSWGEAIRAALPAGRFRQHLLDAGR